MRYVFGLSIHLHVCAYMHPCPGGGFLRPTCHQLLVGRNVGITQHQRHPFYNHYTRQARYLAPLLKNWRILLVQSFTAGMP